MPFKYAPPPRTVAGLSAVPIHITSLDAVVVFDPSSQTASASVTMQFDLGEHTGCPTFDLRQDIEAATLDGAEIPPSSLAHRFFTSNPHEKMRVLAQSLPAYSGHTLELSYQLGEPDVELSKEIEWVGDDGVKWDFWFSDLKPARYLEMWFPSNLIFDEFPFQLDLQLVNTDREHTLLTNGQVMTRDSRFVIAFPATFSSFSHMLVIAPSNEFLSLEQTIDPGGNPHTLETYKWSDLGVSLTNANELLSTSIQQFLADTGPFPHGDRFTTLLWSGGRSMEYNGATTSNISALEHELYHSWYGRGLKPATQNDSWLDEAWTMCVTNHGGLTSQAFNLSDGPVTLCSQEPYARRTASGAYSAGARFFRGLADELGVDVVETLMSDLYQEQPGGAFTTAEFQEYVIRRSDRIDLADFFHRFVYGFDTILGTPDLYMKDNWSDTGTVPSSGAFWHSPDVWIRNADDGVASYQDPEHGQDNWFYARVRNRGSAAAQSFVVAFTVKSFEGTQFVYLEDFQPFFAVRVGFSLDPGEVRILSARWPAELVPAPSTHGCLLAQVYTPDDEGEVGAHVWEHNNLAQRNLKIVDVIPDQWVDVPIRMGSAGMKLQLHTIEIVRRRPYRGQILLVNTLASRLEEVFLSGEPSAPATSGATLRFTEPSRIELTAPTSKTAISMRVAPGSLLGLGMHRPPKAGKAPKGDTTGDERLKIIRQGEEAAVVLPSGPLVRMKAHFRPRRPLDAILRLHVPTDARPGEVLRVVVQQRNESEQLVGGVSVHLRVK